MNTIKEKILNEILAHPEDYIYIAENVIEANLIRDEKLLTLQDGFKRENFYLPKGYDNRKETLFYDFAFGYEAKLAGTGLREKHFQSVFENENFENIIKFIYPQIAGGENWNFENEDELLNFCKGLFNYNIPYFKEALPIRLASYFYPNYFIPIFKLDHLRDICLDFDFAGGQMLTRGHKFFKYNQFIFSIPEILAFDSYMKLYIISLFHYTIELNKRLTNGKICEDILDGYNREWIRNLVTEGYKILGNLNAL